MPGLKTTTEVTAAQKVLKVQLSRGVGGEKKSRLQNRGANEVHPVAEAGEKKKNRKKTEKPKKNRKTEKKQKNRKKQINRKTEKKLIPSLSL